MINPMQIIKDKREAFKQAQKNKQEAMMQTLAEEAEQAKRENEIYEKINEYDQTIQQSQENQKRARQIQFEREHPLISKMATSLHQHHEKMKEETPKANEDYFNTKKNEKVKMF